MEEIKLPTVPELSLIPIERRNFRKRITSGRNERSSAKEKKETMLQEDWSQ